MKTTHVEESSRAMSKVLTLTMNPALDLSTSIGKVVHSDKLRCTAAKTQPGGGGINVARVISRLAQQDQADNHARCTAVYPVGGLTGDLLQEALKSENIDSRVVSISGETREAFSVHETSTGKDFRFLLPGPRLTEAEWLACSSTIINLSHSGDIVVASGSLPPGVPANFFANLALDIKAKGALFVLDTSGSPLKLALAHGVYMIKPSLRELEELTETSLATEAQQRMAAERLVKSGQASVVALSLGERGALVVTTKDTLRAPAIDVPVVSTVGAGDNFLAGFIWALQRSEPVERCLAYAMACAGASVMNRDSNLCDPQVMHALYSRAQVTRLN